MESPNPNKTHLKNACVLDDIPTVLGKLSLAVAQQNSSRIDHHTNTVSSVVSNFPTPNNSPEDLCTKQHNMHGAESIPNSDIDEKKQELPTELDRCDLNISSVISTCTSRKRLLFDSPKKDSTSKTDSKKLCICPKNDFNQVQLVSNAITSHNPVSYPPLRVEELEKVAHIPTHDLKYLENHLSYLVHNIYQSISKNSSKTSPNSFCKASKHILAFKRLVIDHGRHLAEYHQWPIVIEYVFMALKHVCNTPNWDTPTHNTARRQCFKSLLRLCLIALNKTKDKLNKSRQEYYITELTSIFHECKDEVIKCLQLLDFDFNTEGLLFKSI